MFPDNLDNRIKYSAFVSHAHEDQDIVENELIPMLENDSFKLCVHYRDWEVGRFVPDQIVDSVKASHRTIILVTQHYLDSDWCHLEFKIVFENTVNKLKKPIIIFFEGMTVKKLAPRFQAHVSMYTYIERRDPNFWKRLNYALRHDKIK